MKAIYRIFIAIFAAAAFAVSCSKDAVPGGGAQAVDGAPRVITLSYGGSTKAALSDFTPTFRDGDRVMLSNGTRTEECTVNVAGGKATVTTTLTGVLNAVSPASAAVTGGGELTYKIPVTQSGRFSDAAIATAHNIISSAELEIQVSLLKFYVDQSISVRSITVESTRNIATDGTNLKQITVGTWTGFLHEIAEDTQRRLCYAAVLPGIPASSLKFTSDTESQGIVRRQSPASIVTLAANTLYKAFIPYYIKIGSQRWGYCNIGAFLPEEYGDYFAWGEIKGHPKDNLAASFPTENPDPTRYTGGWDATKGFAKCNAPYYTGSQYTTGKYDNMDGLQVLELSDDAAYVNWGPCWSIPSPEDFNVLPSGTSSSLNGITGRYFGSTVFLPNGGTIADFTPPTTNIGRYWTNKLWPDDAQYAYGFSESGITTNHDRFRARPIRPIYKNPVDPLGIEEYDEPENIE